MTFGMELHWWDRPAIQVDLFDWVICLGLATVWFDKNLISEVMRDDRTTIETDKSRRQAVADVLVEKVRGE